MANRFASGKNSIAECDRCGFRFKLTASAKARRQDQGLRLESVSAVLGSRSASVAAWYVPRGRSAGCERPKARLELSGVWQDRFAGRVDQQPKR
jgi:hypothetical protein